MEPLLISIPETTRVAGVGRTKVYELIDAGEIEVVKVGHRTLVVAESLTAYVARLRQERSAESAPAA